MVGHESIFADACQVFIGRVQTSFGLGFDQSNASSASQIPFVNAPGDVYGALQQSGGVYGSGTMQSGIAPAATSFAAGAGAGSSAILPINPGDASEAAKAAALVKKKADLANERSTYKGPIIWVGATRPILIETPFDAKTDALALRQAMKGTGTNENMLIHILCHRTTKQRQAIRMAYTQFCLRDLEKDLKSELNSFGYFSTVMKILTKTPAERDAKFIRKAINNAGSDDTLLIELICGRTPTQIADIKVAYSRLFPVGHRAQPWCSVAP